MRETKPIREFPEDIQKKALTAFHALANAQRGRPEVLATSPKANPGLYNATGAFTWMTEHVGDLTHRMSESYCDRLAYGIEAVAEKVRKALRYFTNGYGFWREVKGNIENNFHFRQKEYHINTDFETFTQDFIEGAKAYADAHIVLTVWNEAQWHAREAAVALGLRHFTELEHHLNIISNHLAQGRESWSDWASMITVDNGELIPYRRV